MARFSTYRLFSGLVAASALAFAACGSPAKGPVAPAPEPLAQGPVSPAPDPAPVREQVKEKTLTLDPLRIQVITDSKGDKTIIHYDARMLLDKANEELSANRFDDAIAGFNKLVAEFPESDLAIAALYNTGLAYEGKREWDNAIARYRAVIARLPSGPDSVDAHVQIGVVLSELHRWGEATTLFEDLLGRTDLSPSSRVEGMARLGYVLVEQKEYSRAEKVLQEAVAYYASATRIGHLDTDYYVAMANYYLGNIPHRQAQAVALRVTGPAGDDQLKSDLKAKRDLVKLAYDRYVLALRRRNAQWATAAGFQMSELFKEFWDDIILAPIPPHLSPREAGFYVKELHNQSRQLLEKALLGHTRNVELAAAYRTSTPWSKASRIQANRITDILARESAGELVEPPRDEDRTAPNPGQRKGAGRDYVPGRVEL